MKLVERFLKYVSFETTSYEDAETFPSSDKVFALAEHLEKELREIGLHNVYLDENAYVYAELPASEGVDTEPIGLMAHMDVSSAASGKDIKPRIIKYEGGDIKLSDEVSILLKDFPEMEKLIGQELIVTDGTTLLGADDKAGIAEIVTAMEYLIAHPEIKHGKIYICFNPEEETGRGTEKIDLERFAPSYAYTLDGDMVGGLEYECFNAADVKVRFTGVSVHPGTAKNKMKNSILIANEFINMLPPFETPSHTENYEGFYHVNGIEGIELETKMSIIVRDHDKQKFEEKKAYVLRVTDFLNAKYGEGTVVTEMHDSYLNMKEHIKDRMEIVERAVNAMEKLGIEVNIKPIRGGTDGSALTFMGIPCPNIGTGGGNYHGYLEYVSIDQMKKAVEVIVELVKA